MDRLENRMSETTPSFSPSPASQDVQMRETIYQDREELDPRKPWGPWATIGIILLAFISVIFADIVGLILGVVIAKIYSFPIDLRHISLGPLKQVRSAFGVILITAIILWWGKGHGGYTLSEYFSFRRPKARSCLKWIAMAVIYIFVAGWLCSWFHLNTNFAEFSVRIYKAAYFFPLFVFSVVLLDPVLEELVFRGFLFKGLLHSRLGATGAIVLSALIFGSIHSQYHLAGMLVVAGSAVLFGIARYQTRSVFVPMMMHITNNLIAYIEIELYMRGIIKSLN